jgi:hypothetical protein
VAGILLPVERCGRLQSIDKVHGQTVAQHMGQLFEIHNRILVLDETSRGARMISAR